MPIRPHTVSMEGAEQAVVPDDQYRGLLTKREREILTGDADVTDNYQYRVVSRVRTKINAIDRDMDVLAEHRPDLIEELREVVCDE